MHCSRLIVFYDNTCGLCQRSLVFILHRDKGHCFLFAPLSGTTAAVELKNWVLANPTVDSIVLLEIQNKKNKLENKTISYYSKAILRILWHFGGAWRIIGVLSFLPPVLLWPFDCLYRAIAKRRKVLCPYSKTIELQLHNFTQLLP